MDDVVKRVLQDQDRPAFKFATDLPRMVADGTGPIVKGATTSIGLIATQRPSPWQGSTSKGGLPELNERALGWLRHLHEKATTVDDWSYHSAGPHEWWDKTTMSPMCSWPRWDLQESSYAVALMADKTPAWREVYTEILDGLSRRYIQHWGAVDFLNQFGSDPKAAEYPAQLRALIPPGTFGSYDAPGWTGNGLNKFPDGTAVGYEKDAVGAEGMLFYKGFLVLIMSIYTRVSGDDKYLKEFDVAGIGNTTTKWTLGEVAAVLSKQWSERECGLH